MFISLQCCLNAVHASPSRMNLIHFKPNLKLHNIYLRFMWETGFVYTLNKGKS